MSTSRYRHYVFPLPKSQTVLLVFKILELTYIYINGVQPTLAHNFNPNGQMFIKPIINISPQGLMYFRYVCATGGIHRNEIMMYVIQVHPRKVF